MNDGPYSYYEEPPAEFHSYAPPEPFLLRFNTYSANDAGVDVFVF
jgi:hypothetical protein